MNTRSSVKEEYYVVEMDNLGLGLSVLFILLRTYRLSSCPFFTIEITEKGHIEDTSNMSLPKRRKLNDSSSEINISVRTSAEDAWTPDWAKKGKVQLCPNDWCTYNTLNGNMGRHQKNCQKNHDEGLRLQLCFINH